MEWIIAKKYFCNTNGNLLKEWNEMNLTLIKLNYQNIYQ